MSVRLPLACLAVLALTYTPARADIPVGPPPGPVEVKLKVEVDEKAKGPVLQLPRGVTGGRVRPAGPKGPPPTKEGKPEGEEPVVLEFEGALAAEPERNPNHVMIAGVAVTLALGLGGIWLVRRPGRSGTRGLALLLAAGGTLAVSSVAWANQAAPKPPPLVVLPVAFEGKIKVEIVPAGDTIKLIVDQETYEQMKKDLKGK
jgi:hypothetical protein